MQFLIFILKYLILVGSSAACILVQINFQLLKPSSHLISLFYYYVDCKYYIF